jgi:ketosteroid isomerase-like protein
MSCRPLWSLLLLAGVAGASDDGARAARPAPPSPAMSAAECEVWERERSFARSVEDEDAAAFAAHLHPGAVFIDGGERHVRGRDAVAADWAAIVANDGIVLRWHPQYVAIGGDPGVAHSRGPYWMENPDPNAPQRYAIGRFSSVWTRSDGEWKVLFDGGGGGRPEPATVEQVEALKASLPETCPRG